MISSVLPLFLVSTINVQITNTDLKNESVADDTTNFMIVDTIEFEGAIILDAENGIFLIEKSLLKKYDIFNISDSKLKRLEDKNRFYRYIETIDYIRLCKQANPSDTNTTNSMPVNIFSGLIAINAHDESDILVGIIKLKLIQLNCDVSFIKENIRLENSEQLETDRTVLYTLVR